MNKEIIKKYFVPLFDFSILLFSYGLSFLIRYDFKFSHMFNSYRVEPFCFVIFVSIYAVFYFLLKLNKTVWHQTSLDEFARILTMSFVSSLVQITFRLLGFIKFMPSSIIIMTGFLTTLFMFFSRSSYRIIRVTHLANLRKDSGERLLIYGAGGSGRMILSEILENSSYNYNVVGFIDDDVVLHKISILAVPVLGGYDDLEQIIKDTRANQVIVAMPSANRGDKQRIIKRLAELKIPTQIVSSSELLLQSSDFRKILRPVNVLDLLGRQQIVIEDTEILNHHIHKVILVTRAGGSIGSELVRQIIKQKPKLLILLDISETGLHNISLELKTAMKEGRIPLVRFKVLIKNIREYDSLEPVFIKYKPQILYHAAAHKHVPLMEEVPEEAIRNNIFGTHNLIKLSKKYEVEKFVNISTDKAVNPTNIMGATKRFNEMMLQAYDKTTKTKFVAVRFGNVLDSNGSVVPTFKKQIEKGGPVTVTHPDITRYFMTIPEAVSLVLQASVYANGGEIFVLNMGDPVKIYDMALKMIELSGLRPFKDIPIEFIGLRPGEKLYEELLLAEEGLNSTQNDLIFIANPIDYDLSYIETSLLEFQEAVVSSETSYKALFSRLVPTYKIED